MSTTRLGSGEVELTRRGLRLAWFTIGYNVVEGVLAVAAGVVAGLVSLVGFGVDSGIESISAVLVACGCLPGSGTTRSTRPRSGGHCGWLRSRSSSLRAT